MKQVFEKQILKVTLALGALALVACGESSQNATVSGDVSVQVPWAENTAKPQLKDKTLLGLESLETLNGRYVKFMVHPKEASSGEINGQDLKAQFEKIGSKFIPKDALSAQLAAVYVHFQKLHQLDASLGIAENLTWPRRVAVVTVNRSGETNNAFYEGDGDLYVFLPYQNSEMPLTVNGGVVAHEHFHAHFFQLITKQLKQHGINPFELIKTESPLKNSVKESKQREQEALLGNLKLEEYEKWIYQAILLRGLNEGLADYWGYLYSSDEDFLKRSLPRMGSNRSLKMTEGKNLIYASSSLLKLISKSETMRSRYRNLEINTEAYALATQHAKFLKALAEKIAADKQIDLPEAKHQLAKILLEGMSQYAEHLITVHQKKELPTVQSFNAILAAHSEFRNLKESCALLQKALAIENGKAECLQPEAKK
ncbi:MAG: hypothetical protein ACLGGX_06780 [Bdellovibrionia bacterium]